MRSTERVALGRAWQVQRHDGPSALRSAYLPSQLREPGRTLQTGTGLRCHFGAKANQDIRGYKTPRQRVPPEGRGDRGEGPPGCRGDTASPKPVATARGQGSSASSADTRHVFLVYSIFNLETTAKEKKQGGNSRKKGPPAASVS